MMKTHVAGASGPLSDDDVQVKETEGERQLEGVLARARARERERERERERAGARESV